MVTIWISGFCVGAGLTGVLLTLASSCVRPDMMASMGMLVGGASVACLAIVTRKRA